MLLRMDDTEFTLEKVGRKAYNLGVLRKMGYPTLEGISLTLPISEQDIEDAWNHFSEPKLLAVRSSMLNEDGEKVSMAGKFETVLGIKTFDNFRNAIDKVLASNDYSLQSAILIQNMFDSDISGVLFTRTEPNDSHLFIESTYGLGETLVGGMVTPDQYLVNRDNLETKVVISNQKLYGIFLESNPLDIGEFSKRSFGDTRKLSGLGKGKFLGSISYFDRKRSSLNSENIEKLTDLAKNIEGLFDSPQDIEWAISGDEVKILQSRPITTFLNLSASLINNNEDNHFLTGFSASSGEVQGTVRTVFNKAEVINEPFIYVGFELNPELLYQLDKILGIVTENGGLLCHASIVARELKIPCLVGVKDVTTKLQQGDKIILNATKGYIERSEKS